MRIADLKTNIIARLKLITDFVEVNWYAFNDVWYPCWLVKFSWLETDKYTTWSNKESYRFDVSVLYNYNNEEESEAIMIDMIEKVIDKINEDTTFSWKCHYSNIISANAELIDDVNKLKVISIVLECIYIKNR